MISGGCLISKYLTALSRYAADAACRYRIPGRAWSPDILAMQYTNPPFPHTQPTITLPTPRDNPHRTAR